MMRYIISLIILITLFSLFSLFEKPAVILHDPKQNREVLVETGKGLKDDRETVKKIYNQEDMEFLKNAYGVGNA